MSVAPNLVVANLDQLRQLVREAVREELRSTPSEASEILTREQAAELLQVHVAVITRYVKNRGLRGVKIGRDWRFRRADITAWLASQGGK